MFPNNRLISAKRPNTKHVFTDQFSCCVRIFALCKLALWALKLHAVSHSFLFHFLKCIYSNGYRTNYSPEWFALRTHVKGTFRFQLLWKWFSHSFITRNLCFSVAIIEFYWRIHATCIMDASSEGITKKN